jgi:hypothetical protein
MHRQWRQRTRAGLLPAGGMGAGLGWMVLINRLSFTKLSSAVWQDELADF